MATADLTLPTTADPTLDSVDDVPAVVARARAVFDSGVTRPIPARRTRLEALQRMVEENRGAFEEALWADLRKGTREAAITEIDSTLGELATTLRHLRSWTRTRRARTPLMLWPSSAHLVPEPLGVVLVIAPWNYPVNLTLVPLVGALAAGNTAVLKPSEESPHTSELLARLVPVYFPDGSVQVLLGGTDVAQRVLAERFDHIFFTGSGRVGRIVMEAAAKNLTPVTLELGGKSPTWVDDDAHLDQVAQRLVWAKFTNAGQTCVAPDYVLTTPDRVPALVAALRQAIEELWGPDPAASPEYGRIVSARHFDRLVGLLDEARVAGTIETGGRHDRSDLYLEPTIVTFPATVPTAVGPDAEVGLLREEIFGPILPILTVASPEEAITVINAWDKPLALYVFSASARTRSAFEASTSSGAIVHGAGLIHVGADTLPFGGVGGSGMGAYHGRVSVETFSHLKPVLTKPLVPDTLRALNPGTSERVLALLSRIQRRG